ncbi:MAG: exodeoxyribonuclease VII large subunit [Acidobacteriota bacterium]|nr:exodeoxyribonuclease VII large subunit [Acidobacteriota bacterium]
MSEHPTGQRTGSPGTATGSAAIGVSEYAARLGRALRAVGGAVIEGEAQKPKVSGSGMLWFSITDGEAVLSCKVFRSQMRALEHLPSDGDLVRITVERPDLWSQAGKLDLIVGQIALAGEGELLRRREELLGRLTAEGLCEQSRWRALPAFPRAVGVIAGARSDAMADVLRALRDRWPPVRIVTCSALVQGKAAPRDLIDALARMQEHPAVDVVIVARGGGSVQDLVCFDDERLCRAMFACALPVVCAVGHTENNPVCNHVTWSAFTPSRSAELVVPSAAALRSELAGAGTRLGELHDRTGRLRERVAHAAAPLDAAGALELRRASLRGQRASLTRAPLLLRGAWSGVDLQADRVRRGARRQLTDHARDYSQALARLERTARRTALRRLGSARERVLAAAAMLAERTVRRRERVRREVVGLARLIAAQDFRGRGWALASGSHGPIRSAAALTPGELIELALAGGIARATVNEVERHGEQDENALEKH